MQLTNIARDVGEDARAGRLYLPRQMLVDAGIDPESFLQAPTFSPALCTVVERLLLEAEQLYRRSESGIALLPVGARPGIYAARLLYAEIGHALLKSSGNSAFDRSAINAVEKAGSFPELQKLPNREFEKTFRRFRLLFRPEDLRY